MASPTHNGAVAIKKTHPGSVHRIQIVNNDKPENSPDYITG
jgi:hypothetical protein